jgi:hypothetical protein
MRDRGGNLSGRSAGFNLSYHVQLNGDLLQIGSPNREAITGSSWKGREVSIGVNGLGQDPAHRLQQLHFLSGARTQLGRMLLDGMAGIFEAEDFGRG